MNNRLLSVMLGLLLAGTALAAERELDLAPRPAMMLPGASESVMNDLESLGERLLAVGERGHILVSTDQGETWHQRPSPHEAMLNRLKFYGQSLGLAIGHDATVLRSTDAGQTWKITYFRPAREKALNDVICLQRQYCVALGTYSLFIKSDDAGKTWTDLETPIGSGQHFFGIAELGDGTLMVVGEAGLLARSNDGGLTWERTATPYFGSLFGIVPVGEAGAVIYGQRGNAFYIPDFHKLPAVEADDFGDYPMGETPDEAVITLQSPAPASYFGGSAMRDGTVLLVGDNGTIVKYTPGSTELRPVDSSLNVALTDVIRRNDHLVLTGLSGMSKIRLQ